MSDPDDDALSWAGDDRLQAPSGSAPRLVDDRPSGRGRTSGDAPALVVLGVLGGVAVLETLLWVRGVTQLSVAASLTTGSGTPLELVAYAANLAGRILAVVSPLVWFGLVAWKVRTPSKRLAWMLLGAVLLVPWPFLLGVS